MARVPRQVARQVIPSGRVAGAFIPMSLADVGQGIEAQGLANLGEGLDDLGQAFGKIAFAAGTSQASTSRGLGESEIRLLKSRLQRNPDPATYNDELEKSIETIKGFRPESAIGGKQFDDFMTDAVPQWQSDINILGMRRTQSIVEGEYIFNRNKAIAVGDLLEADRLTDEAENITGAISPQEAARDRIENEKATAKVISTIAVNNEMLRARAVFDKTGDQNLALDIIRDSEVVPEDEKQGLQGDLVIEIGYRLADAKRRTDALQREQTGAVLGRVNKKEYSGIDDFIDAQPDLTNAQKIKLKKDTRLHAKAELDDKAENSPFNQGSEIVFGKLMKQVRNRPESITNPELFDFVGKGNEDGITLGEYNQLSGIHDTKLAALERPGENPLQHDSVQRAQSSIGRVRTFALVDVEDRAERRSIEAEYQTIQNQLDDFASALKIDDPDFGKKIEKETQRLLRPTVERVVLSWFEKLRLPRDTAFFRALPGKTEGEKLAEKRMKSLEDNAPGIFRSLTKEEKASIRERFRRGATVQEIIELAG